MRNPIPNTDPNPDPDPDPNLNPNTNPNTNLLQRCLVSENEGFLPLKMKAFDPAYRKEGLKLG